MTGLLVSVRNASEAEIALAGGAALIDVKEPTRGALGRADDQTIAAVVHTIGGRRPVSAALGEIVDGRMEPQGIPLTFVKWGLAAASRQDWQKSLTERLWRPKPQTVIVAYADWQCAAAPPIDEIISFACERSGNLLLIDTHCKDAARLPKSQRLRESEYKDAARLSLQRRPTLLDWLSADEAIAICRCCRAAGVRVALAGSLGPAEIETLLPAAPDWFAVRGAVCEENERGGAIRLAKVRALVQQISTAAARSAS